MSHLVLTEADFEVTHGLPRPRWDVIRVRVFEQGERLSRHAAWSDAQREWLRRLAAALQPAYQVCESEHFLALTAARGDVNWVSEYAEQARRQIIELLGERPGEPPVGKVAVLILAGEADYRRYLRHYSPDAGFLISAGCWIRDGDAHIAIAGITGFKTVLVHELVHAHFSPAPRPRWLEEGIAQDIERRLVTRQRLAPGTALRQELRAYWRPRTLQSFWAGEAFNDARPHGARPYAYELANLLVLELASLSEGDLRKFAAAARRDDAGDGASREVYGFGLEVWARKVLGDGDWAPTPMPMPAPAEPAEQ